jgi:hypothetical protein
MPVVSVEFAQGLTRGLTVPQALIPDRFLRTVAHDLGEIRAGQVILNGGCHGDAILPTEDTTMRTQQCQDSWQTFVACDGVSVIVPLYNEREPYDQLATLYTIHNLAYQGNFWHWDMALNGLDWKYFNWQQMEFYGNLNFMKSAITFADVISTVSPTYAKEILRPPLSCGMEGALQHRRNDLFGIIRRCPQ